jgi:lipopolysaccharide export system permease protein
MTEGFRVEGSPGEPAWRLMRFARNELRLPNPGGPDGRQAERRKGFLDLIGSETPIDIAEAHWRMGLPVTALVLALLALYLKHQLLAHLQNGCVLLLMVTLSRVIAEAT